MWPIIIVGLLALAVWQKDNIKELIGVNMTTKRLIDLYFSTVTQFSTQYDVEPSLVLAVIKQESDGNPKAQGPTGDFGLMQITQPALTDFNRYHNTQFTLSDLLDPSPNIRVGTWYLSTLFKQTQDWRLAVQSYNAGLSRVMKNNTAGADYADSVFIHQNTINNEMWSV